ncbi:MAG: hypothetical protein ACR2GY_10245 [Phycisphaerales bacterium]
MDKLVSRGSSISDLLPVIVDLPWLRERLGNNEAVLDGELFPARYEEYRADYLAEAEARTPKLNELMDAHFAHVYVRMGTGRALCQAWRTAIESLRTVENAFWNQLAQLPELDADLLELARLERLCDLLDCSVLNVVPETKIHVRSMLRAAEITVEAGGDVVVVLTEHFRRRAVLMKKRLDAIVPTIDEMTAHLEVVYGMSDDTMDQLTPSHIGAARTKSYVEAAQRMYKANAALAQQTRAGLDAVLESVDEQQSQRLSRLIEHQIYPQVYERADAVEAWLTARPQLAADPDHEATLSAYRDQRHRIEERMIARVNEYRDTWLAATGTPMTFEPMAAFDQDMMDFTEELKSLETRVLRQIDPQYNTGRNEEATDAKDTHNDDDGDDMYHSHSVRSAGDELDAERSVNG